MSTTYPYAAKFKSPNKSLPAETVRLGKGNALCGFTDLSGLEKSLRAASPLFFTSCWDYQSPAVGGYGFMGEMLLF